MSVRQYEEERQKREQFLKRENEALNRHKGELIDKVWALESENKRLREVLEFYADEKNHTEPRGTKIFGDVFYDKGKMARQALEGDSDG